MGEEGNERFWNLTDESCCPLFTMKGSSRREGPSPNILPPLSAPPEGRQLPTSAWQGGSLWTTASTSLSCSCLAVQLASSYKALLLTEMFNIKWPPPQFWTASALIHLFLFPLPLKLKQPLITHALLFSGSTNYVPFSNLIFGSKLLFFKEISLSKSLTGTCGA